MVDFDVQGKKTLSNGPAEVKKTTFVDTMVSPRLKLVLLSTSSGLKRGFFAAYLDGGQ